MSDSDGKSLVCTQSFEKTSFPSSQSAGAQPEIFQGRGGFVKLGHR